MSVEVKRGQVIERDDLLRRLTQMQYARNNLDFRQGSFRARGDVIEVFPAYEADEVIRIELFGDEIERLEVVNPLRGEIVRSLESATVYPANHYVTPQERIVVALEGIAEELEVRVRELRGSGKLLEAQRLEQRTRHDMEMLRAAGVCNASATWTVAPPENHPRPS